MYFSRCLASTGICPLLLQGLGQTHSLLCVCFPHRTGTAGSPDWLCLLCNSAKNTHTHTHNQTFKRHLGKLLKNSLYMCDYSGVELVRKQNTK